MHDRLIPTRQQWLAFLALALASVLCCLFVVVRKLHSGHAAYFMFFWNLFLAWVPLGAAYMVCVLRKVAPLPVRAGFALLWFLFFPNAPYIVTDFVHLHPRDGVLYQYDIITVMAFAMTGLFLGYLSLYLMQETVRAWLGRTACWVFAIAMLALSSFGIYLGRYVRWNSWDAIFDPYDKLTEAARLANPWHNPEALVFSVTFFGFAMVCYLIVYSFTHLHTRANPPETGKVG